MNKSQKAILESSDTMGNCTLDELLGIAKQANRSFSSEWQSTLQTVDSNTAWFKDKHAVEVVKEMAKAHATALPHFTPHSDGKFLEQIMTDKALQFLQQQQADTDVLAECKLESSFEKAETQDNRTWVQLGEKQARLIKPKGNLEILAQITSYKDVGICAL